MTGILSTEPATSVALVTGAARGLGLEVARQLAGTGVRTVVAAREVAAAEAAARDDDGLEALPVGLDITDAASVAAAVEALHARTGRLDVLVNNAAATPIWAETATTADLDLARNVIEVDLFGTWRVVQAFLPLLRASPHPRVVNVSSGAGSHTDPRFGFPTRDGSQASHGVGKAAVNALTALLAAELRDTPIIVNTVCPDFTATVPGAAASGARPPRDSAPGIVWAATLPDDGPRGGFFRDGQPLGW